MRRNLERAESHINGSVHIPLHELLQRADEIPTGELCVHCAAGYRASIATSILLARGHRVIAVDDDYTNAAAAGLTRHMTLATRRAAVSSCPARSVAGTRRSTPRGIATGR